MNNLTGNLPYPFLSVSCLCFIIHAFQLGRGGPKVFLFPVPVRHLEGLGLSCRLYENSPQRGDCYGAPGAPGRDSLVVTRLFYY